MTEYRWPIIVGTAVLVLAIFFGLNFYRQRYLREEPFLDNLALMESVEDAVISNDKGIQIISVTPSSSYRGALKDLIAEIKERGEEYYNQPLMVTVNDRRNANLEEFASQVSPDLYEGARLGNYRSVAESVSALGEVYQLNEVQFSVDYQQLYLQARDGDYYLYLLVPLSLPEGETRI